MKKFAIALAATALVAAACGGPAEPTAETYPATTIGEIPVVHDEPSHEDGIRELSVTMTEFSFTFDEWVTTLAVTAGETVQFIVTNDGVAEHEFRLTTAAEADEHVGLGHSTHDDDDSDMDMDMGGEHEEILLLVAAGSSDTITVTFSEAGEYDIVACLIPGHYEAGMEASVEYS